VNDGQQACITFAGYLSKFVVGFVGISIPTLAFITLVLHVPPTRLIQPFLLILTPAIPVGILMYFAAMNRESPKVFSLLLALSTAITLFVSQLVLIHFGSEFGLISEGLRRVWIPVALLITVLIPTIIFFRSKQQLETEARERV
jgi:uncharacterized membrane protein YdjX (TVP38/TMEM64 family)